MSGLYEEIATGGRFKPRAVRVGDRFGELTVEALEASGGRRGRLWRCRCDCGGAALRTSSALNSAARRGASPSCLECAHELRRAHRHERGEASGVFWARFFRQHGTVWPRISEERLVQRIAADLEEAGHRGAWECDAALSETGGAVDAPKGDKAIKAQQRMASLFPLSPPSAAHHFVCADCSALGSRGYGCVDCLRWTCLPCVRAGAHRHHESEEGLTLRAIAEEWGLGPERIRQIESRALRKLMRAAECGNAPAQRLFEMARDAESPFAMSALLRRSCVLGDLRRRRPILEIARRWGLEVSEVREMELDEWWRERTAVPVAGHRRYADVDA